MKKIVYPLLAISLIMTGLLAFFWVKGQKTPRILTLATGSKQGQYYAFGQALAEVLAKHNPYLQIKVIETEGSKENLTLLAEQKADLAIIQSNIPINPSINAVSFLFPEVFHLLATRQSGIHHVRDLQGKRIALMPKVSGSYDLFGVLRNHYGLAKGNIEEMPMPAAQAYQSLAKGQVDALFEVTALNNPAISQLLQTNKVELVPIEQGEALRLTLPALEDFDIPIGAYNGAVPIPDRNLSGVAVRSVLVTRGDLNPEIISEITRILYEARNDLVKLFPQAATIKAPDSPKSLGFAFHPGAIAYYEQDKPSFIVQYSEPIGLLVSVSVLVISGLWQFRMWLEGNQKNRADLYNLKILKLNEQIEKVESLEELSALRRQLFEIFETVIVDLDLDRISAESFQSFTFPWQIALDSIYHREIIFFLNRPSLSQEADRSESNSIILKQGEKAWDQGHK